MQAVCSKTKENKTAKSTDYSDGKIQDEKECTFTGR